MIRAPESIAKCGRGESASERLRFAGLVTLLFVLATLPRLLLHELWRDEAWLWLVITESPSFSDLVEPLSRSGQGLLFPFLGYVAAQVSSSPVVLQLVHLLLAGGAAFVFVRWAPFGRLERALVVLGYFPFYEYAVISRHYAAGALLLWLACLGMRSRRPALALGVTLGLLCQTTVYGVILAGAIAGGFWLDRRLRRTGPPPPLPRWERAAGWLLGVTGLVVGIAQLRPLPDTSFAPGWRFGWDAAQAADVAKVPWRALVPVPWPELHFWNGNLLDAWPAVETTAGLLAFALAIVWLWPRRVALAVFVVGAGGNLAFGYVKYLGTGRHHGHLWLLLLAALWVAGDWGARSGWRSVALRGLLLLHCAAGLFASWMDLRHPFSNGPAIAARIRSEGLERFPLFGHREPPSAAVALPLGRPLYSPSRGLFVTHPDYGPEQRELGGREVRCAARELARREGKDVVLVMNWEIPAWPETSPVGSERGAIVATEDFHLYRLHHDRLGVTAVPCEGAAE